MTRQTVKSPLLLTACFMSGLSGTTAMAEGNAEAGAKVFKRCTACHQVGDGAKNRTGPALTNIVGNAAGMREGYKYSKSLKAAGETGLVWSEENLIKWLMGPTDYMKEVLSDDKARSKMSFKLRKTEEAQDVIAYLASFSSAKNDAPTNETHAEAAHGDHDRVLLRGPGMRTAQDSALPQPGDDDYEIAEYSTAEDLEYMDKIVAKMKELRLLGGPEAIQTPVYPGMRPHGMILGTIITTAEIDGHVGELIVKRSFDHPGAESDPAKAVKEVQADPDQYLHDYTVMFKREDGYQDAHNNWYYAEFDPAGKVISYEGNKLVGRNDLCISCHVLAEGDDYLFTTDGIK